MTARKRPGLLRPGLAGPAILGLSKYWNAERVKPLAAMMLLLELGCSGVVHCAGREELREDKSNKKEHSGIDNDAANKQARHLHTLTKPITIQHMI
jgi:hypothetical protein